MTEQEKQQLIARLRNLRDRMEAPKPDDVEAAAHYARLCGAAVVVLDDALVTLSN
jgi:hypothetical protein